MVAAALKKTEDFIRQASRECVVSIAHTACDYEEARAGIEAGCSHLTHLYNAMNPLQHRDPGPIAACAEADNVMAELICDGIHIHPAAVRAAFKLFPGRICLISDAMRACGMAEGESFDLGGQQVTIKNGTAVLPDGTIAGSATNLFDCMTTAVSFGIPLADAVRAAAVNPAKAIGIFDRVGSLEPGKRANVVVLDPDLNVKAVFFKGRRV